MSWPASNARSSCGNTVESKPTMPGKRSSPRAMAPSRLSRISCLTVFVACPDSRSSPSVVGDVTSRRYAVRDAAPVARQDRPALAIDIGGSKLAAAVVDSGGRILVSAKVPTPHQRGLSADGLWRTVVGLVRGVASGAAGEFAGIGVGCGGPMRWPDGVVSPLNIAAWREFPLRDRLRDEFAGLPVRAHNDAVCLAVGEHWRGAGRGASYVLGMVVSTGVGGGLVLGGRLVDGISGNAASRSEEHTS